MLCLYSLYDEKSCRFNPIQMMYSDEDAKRTIKDLVYTQPNSLVSKFPKDFKLYSLGQFDEVNGHFLLNELPKLSKLCCLSSSRTSKRSCVELTSSINKLLTKS